MPPKQPLYPLVDVVTLAKAGKVTFHRNAQRDYMELGLSTQQAKDVIAWLTIDEFRKTLSYDEPPPGVTYDDYLVPKRLPDGTTPSLYIKLRIPSPASVDYVYVTSFHKQRPIE